MTDKRINVWVQRFPDRANLMLQWTDPETGKRKSKSAETADADQAERKRSDLEYELNNGLHKQASAMTWEKFRELFEAEYVAATRKNTRKNYKAALDGFERLCNPRRLRGISERTISQFVAALRKEPGKARGTTMNASTIKMMVQFLHTALSWAAAQKMLTAVPAFPDVHVVHKDPQPVPAETFERLLLKAEGDPHMQAFLLCGWLAGLRLTEALTLEWEETGEAPYLDFARSRIVLPGGSVKGKKDQWVPLAVELRQAIERLPRQGARVFRFLSQQGDELREGGSLTSGVSRAVATLAKRAGVRLTMKSLRRGFGCRYAGKVPAQVLQKLMRHANIKTTMDFYANVDDAVEKAILGEQRNTLRNTNVIPADDSGDQIDVNHSPETSKPHSES